MSLRDSLVLATERKNTTPATNPTSLYQVVAYMSAVMFYDKIIVTYMLLFISRVASKFASPQAMIKKVKT
jgi:hypothetical protein